jgi:hypothetical protein
MNRVAHPVALQLPYSTEKQRVLFTATRELVRDPKDRRHNLNLGVVQGDQP